MAKILITGANGGFGALITEALLHGGHQVVASIRDAGGRNQAVAQRLQAEGARVVSIDVTDDQSVADGVTDAVAQLGGLDVLINNAGTGVHGHTEAFTADDLNKVFDINVYGLHRMTRAVLPTFRAQKSGLVINISSLLGRISIPFYGPYNASKWAVEALTENYRAELSGFGVEFALVEPGGFPTTFIDNLLKPSDRDRVQGLGEFAQAPAQSLAGFEQVLADNPQQSPALVADAVRGLVEAEPGTRPFRTVVDKLGMGDPVAKYNEHLAQLTHGIYSAFGTEQMLTVARS